MLELRAFDQSCIEIAREHATIAKARGLLDSDFNKYINTGLLLCHPCKTWFPILRGVPVLLPYAIPIHHQFATRFQQAITRLPVSYGFPAREPVPGERFVLNSFSREWLEYDYDGVIWEMSYEDQEKRFLSEMAFMPGRSGSDFLEIGCGLGITTQCAHAVYQADAVGVDLSLAAFRAAEQYKTNPFLHFAQASVFFLPFPEQSFDILYSRGVLHHTYSTHAAFEAIAPYCRVGGGLYVWLYGKRSIDETWLRRAAYVGEVLTRPVLSRWPDSWPAAAFLSCTAMGYMAYNAFRRVRNPEIQRLTFRRAVHAARDRFTPRYAYRHAAEEVIGWFHEVGFRDPQILDWQTMPAADRDDYRRNIGIGGIRTCDAAVLSSSRVGR